MSEKCSLFNIIAIIIETSVSTNQVSSVHLLDANRLRQEGISFSSQRTENIIILFQAVEYYHPSSNCENLKVTFKIKIYHYLSTLECKFCYRKCSSH